ncbi:deoxyguanosinetriphosphate triphosphohydrolase [Paucibacter sp. APW11]|uniref:Deoxyguanosinetriphosphate triphosphohydrolase-like protein n=1 Tax=Roseateles aquae TaxID=3077235 RepID=A0ABU3PI64_9BURK|nr:deoxyguanosinetriphosphate triphosphohydrolase [Paucibacter sp. APW11]MDT9002144.1 deoxyguanosinetriphosphate triphosphohydrolase [Paucibacter sp. APW11]
MTIAALAPYASHAARSRGRRHAEADAPTRSCFQRDRDRIVHSTAFRRLVYKTQVFLNHEGDLFRTRLTHSLEVAQLGRSIGRSLRLDEDLIETIALAHDLGHTPFGHAGQDVLDECMAADGGFEHNLQSLRVVDQLEQRYPAFDGLNLCYESREGILKHCARSKAEQLEAQEPQGVAYRFLHGFQPSLEAQLCNLADEVAYNAHDIDDGVRSGLLELEQLREVPLVDRYLRETLSAYPQLQGKRLLFETIRRMLSQQVYDIVDASSAAIEAAAPADEHAVRQAPPLIRFSSEMRRESSALKKFLFAKLYRHPQVQAQRQKAEQVLRELFSIYRADPGLLPDGGDGSRSHARACADYIAGMTDRFALKEHERLTGRRLFD